MANKFNYRIKHVGINTNSAEESHALAEKLVNDFGLEGITEKPTANFAGEIFEIMKHSNIGTHGHIAIQTDDVEGAMQDLIDKGYTVKESSIKRHEDGRIHFVYFNEQLGGFCFHLTE